MPLINVAVILKFSRVPYRFVLGARILHLFKTYPLQSSCIMSVEAPGKSFFSSNQAVETGNVPLLKDVNLEQDHVICANTALTDFIDSKNSSSLVIEKKAKNFCDLYKSLPISSKPPVLDKLAQIWSCKQDTTLNFVKKYLNAQEKGNAALIKAEEKLRNALAADQGWFLTSLGRQEGGIIFLLDIRADILDLISSFPTARMPGANAEALKSLSHAIRDLVAPCFGVDFLKFERVTWSSPGNILQHISEGEAVHPIRSWSDLKKRLGPYRRCFIVSHQSLSLRPLAILHVALTTEISSTIHSIINRVPTHSVDFDSDQPTTFEMEDNRRVNTAIFYSISSTHKGLTGIDLGQSLIKRAVKLLHQEAPNIKQFSTLSPIPGFRSWLLHQLKEAERGHETILAHCNWADVQRLFQIQDGSIPYSQLRQILNDNSWIRDELKVKCLETILMKLCAFYLFAEKRRGFALDSVANFHLRNGAVMWRINWAADLSPRGIKNSLGLMVNYRYYLEDCESNSQSYVEKQQIHCSEQIQNLSLFASQFSNLSRL